MPAELRMWVKRWRRWDSNPRPLLAKREQGKWQPWMQHREQAGGPALVTAVDRPGPADAVKLGTYVARRGRFEVNRRSGARRRRGDKRRRPPTVLSRAGAGVLRELGPVAGLWNQEHRGE